MHMPPRKHEWVTVTKARRCPICEKPDWCRVTADGELCKCMRVANDRPTPDGGWLYVLVERDRKPYRPPPPPPKPKAEPVFNAAEHMAALRMSWSPQCSDGLSMMLGVCPYATERLQPAYDDFAGAFAFPMRDGTGKIAGVRLRAPDGSKWAVTGSKQGLFMAHDWKPLDGLAVVCEGPTDTLAAMTIGLPAIGRPSCCGGGEELREVFARHKVRQVIIIADNDPPKFRPDGSVWRPGTQNIEAFAKSLKRMYKIVVPPKKDIRTWLHSGLTREVFDAFAGVQKWNLP